MSVFRVALNNSGQGLLDRDPTTASAGAVSGQGLGDQISPSLQRGVYVVGPNLINRLLIDGATFTDCNYWKRYAFPQVPYNEAIVEVITDDGSVYSDVASENVFPRVYDTAVAAGSTWAANQIDIAGDTGGFAVFAQITNNGAESVKIRLNGLTTAVFDLAAGNSQVFAVGDISLSLIEFDHTESGASVTNDIQTIVSVRSVCNS